MEQAQELAALKAKLASQVAPIPALSPGGTGAVGADVPDKVAVKLDQRAINNPHLFGLDQKKREGIGIRNMDLALGGESQRVQVHAARNLIAMERLHQEAERERLKHEAGGDHVNVHVDGELTETKRLELIIKIRDELADIPGAAPRLAQLLARQAVEHANGKANGHAS